MRITSIKRWHWMILGTIAGVAIAYGQFSFLGEKSVGLGDGQSVLLALQASGHRCQRPCQRRQTL